MHEYCLSGKMINQDESDAESRKVGISRLLLASSRGDQLVEYCQETNVKIEVTVASIITPLTRRQAIESSTTSTTTSTKWVFRVKYGAN